MISITIKENDALHALIQLKGELDTLAAEQFATDIHPLLDDAGKEITVDFSQLQFISSAGMRTLLVLNRKALSQHGKVIITGMSEDIRQIFEMTGFDQMFDIIRQ